MVQKPIYGMETIQEFVCAVARWSPLTWKEIALAFTCRCYSRRDRRRQFHRGGRQSQQEPGFCWRPGAAATSNDTSLIKDRRISNAGNAPQLYIYPCIWVGGFASVQVCVHVCVRLCGGKCGDRTHAHSSGQARKSIDRGRLMRIN
eukprot:GHVU01117134.1.p1 GENE.GHVU01117134.1~~GHVU01117134.1.p1  ORF type:complete len:146 (+),score=6.62 GHVU01117134.1:124-561(+)